MVNYLLLFLSAFIGAAAFVWPTFCWWFIFIFMVPLLLYALYYPQLIAWKSGLVWGIVFFGLHSYWIVWLMREKSQAPLLGLIAALLFIAFCSVHVALWFAVAQFIARFYKAAWFIAIEFATIALVFWWWLGHCIFWVTGQCDGYPMAFPLLPLAQVPQLLFAARWLSMMGLLVCLVAFSLSISLFIYYKKFSLLIISLLWLSPFLSGFVLRRDTSDLPPWADAVGYVAAHGQSLDHYANAVAIGRILTAYHVMHPRVRLIVMPESTCAFALNEYPRFISQWDVSLMHDDVALILGGHEKSGENLFNTIYCICKGNIVARHHKTHCVPLVEHIPAPWSRFPFVYSLFLSGYCPFSAGDRHNQVIHLGNNCHFIPMICSELFFAQHAPMADIQVPVLCIINDSWFIPYMRYLPYLSAKCKAVSWQRVILYIGHYDAFWIKPDGLSVSIGTIANHDANPV